MTYDFSKSTDHKLNLDFDGVKNLQQTDKSKKPKRSDKTNAKYVCEECQTEGCRLYCMWTMSNVPKIALLRMLYEKMRRSCP